MKLFDCTLRDGANVAGHGFSEKLTVLMLEGLIANGIKLIEFGNAHGLGAYEAENSVAPLTDEAYLKAAEGYTGMARLGMFIKNANATEERISLAAAHGLSFLRVGANAGEAARCVKTAKQIRDSGLTPRFSLMKGYILPADGLAEEAKILEDAGYASVTIMDSAGTMTPSQVREYVSKMKNAVKIEVGFHGHNNLGLSVANALAAAEAGADILDCGLMGMARSAGNLPTEMAMAVIGREYGCDLGDFYGLLDFIDNKLAPETAPFYTAPVKPVDLVYGYAGCHSSFGGKFKKIAEEYGVNVYKLIARVSAIDKKAPSETLMRETAAEMSQA